MSTLYDYHNQFCNHSEAFKGNTKASIKWLKKIFNQFAENTKINKLELIDQKIVEDWIYEGKFTKQWSSKTIRNKLCALSLFFDWCVEKQLLEGNPVNNIPKPKLPKSIPKHLDKEEAFKLLEWTKYTNFKYQFDKYRAIAIIAMFLFSGIRSAELRGLRMNDVDLNNRAIYVKAGKGDKDRIIPMNATLIPILEDYIIEREKFDTTCDYFFICFRRGIGELSDKALRWLMFKMRKASGIYFYPHMLRHTFATLMLEGGCDIYSLSKMMGHSDIQTTTIYLSATVSMLQKQILRHPLSR